MSKHTPGPWVVSSLTVRAAGNGYEVARVHCNFKIRGKEGREEYEYAQGNAHLIAAAPEMLETLKDCYELIAAEFCSDEAFAMQGHPIDKAARTVWDKVCAAIAKAEGRE